MKFVKTAWILIFLLACNLALSAAIPAAERQALVDLYNSTNGASWAKKTNWLGVAGTENTWFGVSTDDGNTTVLRLLLPNNNLVGTLPTSLGNLTNLQNLWLSSNQLTGSIPTELGNLSNLQILYLTSNQLTGSIPTELGNLSNLQVLNLYSNRLTGSIPSSLGNLSNLLDLDLWVNHLTGSIPSSLGNLSNLQTLFLYSNQLTGSIPSSLGNLSNLESLYLYSNQLTGSIPMELGNLRNLQYLSLHANQLSGSIPAQLGNLSSLKALALYSNQLTGSIPSELGNLSKLHRLDLQTNQLTGSIPTSLTNLTSLSSTETDIGYNSLHTSDAGLISFLNSKDHDWASTQTIAPTNVSAAPGSASVNVSWTPITYSGDTGGYRILYSIVGGGPYTFYAQTANKSASLQLVSGLTPGIPHYFVVQTRTDAHTNNQNVVDSENSDEVSATPGITSEPRIALSKTSLVFGAMAGGASTSSQPVVVSNSGGGTLAWTAASNQILFSAAPAAGTGTGTVSVSVNASGLTAGTYTGTITVSSTNATNSPQTIAVQLVVKGAGATLPPFGEFSTPIDNTKGITGAIPVTGWVVDDVEVTKVEVKRVPCTGEPPGAIGPDRLVFVGDAIFVEGARPDIETGYPGYPMNYKAGWGYMLLTNCLPNQGNGTYELHAFATDKEGNRALLGTKTITCDNAHAVKPFGTIDSPTQGGDASGNPYLNFGWVLTPLTKTAPKDGSTILVYVDGAYVGSLGTAPNVYDQYRVDVSTAFPGLNNTGAPGAGGPVGAYFLDTTKYANGVHTIAWVATDDGGAADGIGSRYFNILNTESVAQASSQAINLEKADSFESVMNLPVCFDARKAKKGFSLITESEVLQPDNYGTIQFEIKEVERIEVELGKGTGYRGHLVVEEDMRPLPIGSTLNSINGTFSWLPGPGFIGTYEFIFIKEDGLGMIRRIPVKVTIRPKFERK